MRHRNWIARNGSTDDPRADLWRWLESEWAGVQLDYARAGYPLGFGQRAVDLWAEFGTLTTAN
jgi:hypothetical protein